MTANFKITRRAALMGAAGALAAPGIKPSFAQSAPIRVGVLHSLSGTMAISETALRDTVLLGCKTNTAFLRRLIAHPAFVSGDVHTGFLDANPQIAAEPELPAGTLQALLAAAALSTRPMVDIADAVPDMHAAMGGWRN